MKALIPRRKSLKSLKAEIKKMQTLADSLHIEIKKEEGVKEIKKVLITTFKAETKPFEAFVELQGTSQAENNVNITTDMGGLVNKIYVDEGQNVSAGQTLIKLDNSIQASQLSELETSISLAKDVYEKRKRLWEKNIGSEIEFLQAQNNYNSLIDKKNTLIVQMGKALIKSPISGKVDMVFLKAGELASPGMPAVNVVNLRNMEVEVSIPETYLGKIQKGDKVAVYFPTLGKDVDAKIKSVGQSINKNNRTFNAVASIPNKDGSLKPNLLAKVMIKSQSEAKAIAIPSNLLQKSSKGFYVYTVNQTDSAKLKASEVLVEVGPSYNGFIVIKKGLKEGDLLIQEGFREVLQGDLLEIAK